MRLLSCARSTVGLGLLFFFFSYHAAQAGSATWNAAPTDGRWTTTGNWIPATVPNSPTDAATFEVSSVTTITVPTNIEVASITFEPGASPFTIMTRAVSPGTTLSISGAGVINNSGITQNFLSPNALVGPGTAEIRFLNNASAGSQTIYTTEGALGAGGGIFFQQSASAGAATFINEASSTNGAGGFTEFLDTSTAANGVFVAQGNRFATASIAQIIFVGSSTAESGVFTCEAASVSGGIGGLLKFDDIGSTAADAVITLQGATVSGAGSGFAQFFGSSTAGNSKITATAAATGASPASVEFAGDSTGGAAQISLASNTQLIVSAHRLPGVAVGSVDGSGNIILGTSTTAGRKLTVGTNNLEMAISGTISDGGNAGSIVKAGTGRLILSGASTYTGGTTLSAGTLSVTNRIGSATGTGAVQVAAGTLGGSGIIAGPATIATGSVASFLAPALGSSRQATLTIQDALTFNSNSTYAHSFKAKGNQTKADSVVANGVTIASGATVTFRGTIQGTLPAGLVISLISNTSASPISGTFSNLADGAIATISGNNFQADYEGGDGNDLTLTVVP